MSIMGDVPNEEIHVCGSDYCREDGSSNARQRKGIRRTSRRVGEEEFIEEYGREGSRDVSEGSDSRVGASCCFVSPDAHGSDASAYVTSGVGGDWAEVVSESIVHK